MPRTPIGDSTSNERGGRDVHTLVARTVRVLASSRGSTTKCADGASTSMHREQRIEIAVVPNEDVTSRGARLKEPHRREPHFGRTRDRADFIASRTFPYRSRIAPECSGPRWNPPPGQIAPWGSSPPHRPIFGNASCWRAESRRACTPSSVDARRVRANKFVENLGRPGGSPGKRRVAAVGDNRRPEASELADNLEKGRLVSDAAVLAVVGSEPRCLELRCIE